MGIFIYTFTATGKTTLSKKYSNVIDMESTKYKYINEDYENESLKSTNRIINKEWPNNYFNELLKEKDKYDYILISDEVCNSFLKDNNIDYWWVYPKRELKEEYLERCKKRGNNKEFIYWYNKLWDKWIDECINDNNASKHIELNSNEYLEDVLPNLKLKEEYYE